MESHEGDEEKIAAFMEIVGKPADKAREFLQATNWHLEEAIQLFYAGGDDLGSTAPTGDATTELPWDATANQSESGLKPTTSSPIEPGEDYVRPPLPVKREALYDDIFEYRAQHLAQSSNQPASIDAFRNFQDEANFRNQASGDDASNIDGSKDSLAALYRPPFTLIYQGSFEQAKVEAAKQGKWLLVNLQSTKEFSSYMLNRDTWAHHTVQYMVQSMFIFWQVYDDTEEGRKVCTYYKLTTMPTIMIVDPLTGQKMRSWEGMVGAERLLEDLVLYTDRGPLEHKPANLPPPKRQRESNYPKDTFAGPSNSSEEEELQRALAASLQDTREVPMADKNGITSEYEDVKPDTIKDTPKVDAKLQYPPLPEEPAYTDATVCRIAVRFPDGSRGQRKFLRTDPIQVLWSFCLSKVGEASNGKSFRLTESIPGVVGKVLDFNLQSSIGDAGLANSILVMTWD
ncbi:hypothetical protein KP509_02G072100 [Ceratopteris richardii]|uniref:UBX domain-containing protein n=1 Tax=Ceratopteris richardii TaxID=49495 RepID=A0A8T2V711_CERRI|nr:hypothetical protein KP509_02G072100 [Ceratopteris richardii]